MNTISRRSAAALTLCWPLAAAQARDDGRSFRDRLGPLFNPQGTAPAALQRWHRRQRQADHGAVRRWNEIAIDTSGIDHTPVVAGETRVFGEQLGPGRSARAMAIVHIAMFESANAVAGGYDSHLDLPRARGASMEVAVAQAAHDTLAALFPSQADALHEALDDEAARQRGVDPGARAAGSALGRRAAAAVLAQRADDGASHVEPRVGEGYLPSDQPGHWRQDPVSRIPIAMGAQWAGVRPFVLRSAQQFRLPPPPALASAQYTAAFDEVKRLGGDGITTPTTRSEQQTFIGLFWAYDGTPSLCAPPRLYNQLAMQIAEQRRTQDVALARLLALVNVSMADAALAAWDSKYHHKLWRPVTAIREADAGSGPTGAGDGNPDTIGDAAFVPLGAPASNLRGPNFTPPFPAYPSGHATFGGALFQTLRNFYGTDRIAFTFVSDEFNGVTRDNQGHVRLLMPRRFANLASAEAENGYSRILLGIHWIFDSTQGIAQGRQVADHVHANLFTREGRGR